MKNYLGSIRNAFGIAVAGMGAAALVNTAYAFWSAGRHFENLAQSFAHYAQPENILATAALCAVIGGVAEAGRVIYAKQQRMQRAPAPRR